jgi:hypothetical protein
MPVPILMVTARESPGVAGVVAAEGLLRQPVPRRQQRALRQLGAKARRQLLKVAAVAAAAGVVAAGQIFTSKTLCATSFP